MTNDNLFEILGVLEWIRNTESCADAMMEEEVDRCIKLVKDEISNNIESQLINEKH